MNKKGSVPPAGRKYIEKPVKSALPIWTAAAVWVAAALFFPLAKLSSILITAVVSFAAAWIVRRIVPKETIKIAVPFSSGDEVLDAMVGELERAADAVAAARRQLGEKRPQAARYMDGIAGWIGSIRDEIIADPASAKTIRRFVNYYLPTAVKISSKFADTADKKNSGENIRTALDSMEEALYRIEDACRRQYDALFADDVLDITTDIEVLEQMLTRDNLK